MLGPLLERAAVAPHVLDHRAEAAIAAADEALDHGGLGVVPLELDAVVAPELVAQQVDLALELLAGVLPEPLERGERLGHEAAERDRDRRVLVVLLADARRTLRASVAMPRVSSSVSVGSPVRKYSFMRRQPCE